MFAVPKETVFVARLIAIVAINANLISGIPVREFQIITDPENSIAIDGEPIDLLVSTRSGDQKRDQRLFGTFSAAGRNYETSGDIVQVF